MTTDHIPQPDPDGWALHIETLRGVRIAIAWYDDEKDARDAARWINALSAEMKDGPADTWEWVEVRPLTRERASRLHASATPAALPPVPA